MGADWELFAPRGGLRAGPTQGCFVTVSTQHQLILSTEAMAALGQPVAVQILWDARQRRIGLRACAAGTTAAYAIHRNNKRGRNGTLTIARVVRHYGLTPRPGRHPAVLDGDVLAFAIDD